MTNIPGMKIAVTITSLATQDEHNRATPKS